ncbi:MAG: energy transducer TonB [Candidatus Eisenbacteria sp.]|nr:energy transducer TonB [Candidatus Eisenbacteria bacterium]
MFTPNWYESAHEKLKQKYKKYMFCAALAALVLSGLGMVFSPPYVESPYQLRERKVQAVNVSTEIYIPPPPKELSAPELPVQDIEASDAEDAEETMGITDFNPFEPPAIPQASGGVPPDFVAYDSPPEAVHLQPPEYPDLAKQAQAEGMVMVEVVIDENGRVIHASIYDSDTTEILELAALAAAKKCLFKPAMQRDTPVKCRVCIPFNFTLNK